ncbi:MAG: hypothetical protein Q7J25_10180 [Vicinamibacterales bacterium]|nr:hypothetical protein [Vicinamibacterales bacterium]
MTSRSFALVVVGLLSFGLSACRQADGPMPERSSSNRQDDIEDIGKDLMNVVGKDANGPAEMTEDLQKLADAAAAKPKVEELAGRLKQVLPGVKITPPESQQLAEKLWQGITATEITERQVKALQEETKVLLVNAGVPESEALSTVAVLADIQKATTRRVRRWYELF